MLIMTETQDPLIAVDYLRSNLGRIRQAVGEEMAILLQRNKVVPLDARGLLERRLQSG